MADLTFGVFVETSAGEAVLAASPPVQAAAAAVSPFSASAKPESLLRFSAEFRGAASGEPRPSPLQSRLLQSRYLRSSLLPSRGVSRLLGRLPLCGVRSQLTHSPLSRLLLWEHIVASLKTDFPMHAFQTYTWNSISGSVIKSHGVSLYSSTRAKYAPNMHQMLCLIGRNLVQVSPTATWRRSITQ